MRMQRLVYVAYGEAWPYGHGVESGVPGVIGAHRRTLGVSMCFATLFQIAALTILMSHTLFAATYYVDSQAGADTNSGLSPMTSWKTLRRIDAEQFRPGDRILFQSGDRWQGQLAPRESGAVGRPIVFDRYGEGPLPEIDGDGMVEDTILLRNVQQIEIRHLAVTNQGLGDKVRRGVDLVLDNYGSAHHIVIADLYIHDVNGTLARKDNGGIVFRTLGRRVRSRFDDLEIERNIVWNADRSGIAADSSDVNHGTWRPSLNVLIVDNYVADIGGDGIVPWATEDAVVDGNVADHCNQRSHQANAGIWQWSTDNTFFTMNEAFGTGGTLDGEGFDSDFNSRNTRFFRNFSHDNQGGFMLICTPADHTLAWNVGNVGTRIEENISRDDDGLLINLSGATQVTVADNVFYVGRTNHAQFITSSWNGWSKDASLRSNSFYVQGSLVFGHGVERLKDGTYRVAPGWGGASHLRFTDNRIWGTVNNPPAKAILYAGKQTLAQQIDWSSEPKFNPAYPMQYKHYLTAHRAWLLALFNREFSADTPHGEEAVAAQKGIGKGEGKDNADRPRTGKRHSEVQHESVLVSTGCKRGGARQKNGKK